MEMKTLNFKTVLAYFILFIVSNDSVFAFPSGIMFLDKNQKSSVDYQVDAYYSQTAFNFDFKENPSF